MNDLKYIKKHYGEKMMQLCRSLFPTILEEPGKLSEILNSSFIPSKLLYTDIVEQREEINFKKFIEKKYKKEKEKKVKTNKNPFELLRKVGYTLYECHTEDEIQEFKKYYAEDERLCTFNGGRLRSCYVLFAVKDGADKLNRDEFISPQREDEYGISVISIQFSKVCHTLSIKNRYNHTVKNPDSTYSNNLENIIPGLTYSFEKYFGFTINQSSNNNFELNDYIEILGKFYRYNYEISNIYYCSENIIISNGKVIEYPKEKYIVMDYYILDLVNKKIILFDERISDSLPDIYINIKKIDIKTEKDKKIISIITEEGIKSEIIINKYNQIISYRNENIKLINVGFMYYCKKLEYLELSDVIDIHSGSFNNCHSLCKIFMPKLRYLGNGCFTYAHSLKSLYIPMVVNIGDECFEKAGNIDKLYLPELMSIGRSSFFECLSLLEISFPKVKYIEQQSFRYCYKLTKLELPSVIELGKFCFESTEGLEEVIFPNLEKMGECCFSDNYSMKRISIPKLVALKNFCFSRSRDIEEIDLPLVRRMEGKNFRNGVKIKRLYFPELVYLGYDCFEFFYEIEELDLPLVKFIEIYCFCTSHIGKINVPLLKECRNESIIKAIRRQRREHLMPKNIVERIKQLFRKKDKVKVYKK